MSDLASEELTVAGLFAEVSAALGARLSPQIAQHGLSVPEFEVLLRLARSPEHSLRMTDLAAQATLTTSGVTRLVDRLVARRLVARRGCETDRRTTYAVVTEQGLELLHAVLPGHVALIHQMVVEPLAEAGKLDQLTDALRLLRDLLAPCATAGSEASSTVSSPAGAAR